MSERRVAVVVVMAIVAGAVTARAEAPPEAVAHQEAGKAAHERGDYRRAIDEFTMSYTFDYAPVMLFNIAQAHTAIGDWDMGMFYYRRFLADAPQSSRYRPIAERNLAEIQRRLAGGPPAGPILREAAPAPPPAPAPAPAQTPSSPAPKPSPPRRRLPPPPAFHRAPVVEKAGEKAKQASGDEKAGAEQGKAGAAQDETKRENEALRRALQKTVEEHDQLKWRLTVGGGGALAFLGIAAAATGGFLLYSANEIAKLIPNGLTSLPGSRADELSKDHLMAGSILVWTGAFLAVGGSAILGWKIHTRRKARGTQFRILPSLQGVTLEGRFF